MNEHHLEVELREWMADDAVTVSPWVLPSVVDHAQRHSNQGLRDRARGWLVSLLVAPTGPARLRPAAIVAVATTALAVVLAFGLLLPAADETRLHYPAFLTVPELGDPGHEAGAVGSLWLEHDDGKPVARITLHPDGTIVRINIAPKYPVGIGVWRKTGERSLSAVMAYPDGDIVHHLRPGITIYRAEWEIDEAAQTAEVTWSATATPADGSGSIEAHDTSTLTRLTRRSLPPEAKYPAPPEPDWELGLGPMIEGAGSGTVAAMAADCSDSFDTPNVEFGDPPEYLVLHGDGTAFLASLFRDDGAGLWVRTGPDARALTSWFVVVGSPQPHSQVAQLVGTQQMLVLTGDSEQFRDKNIAARRRIEPMDEPLPPVDPALWPETGSVWLTSLEAGTAITAFLTDGTVIALDPRYGTGVGYWQPLEAGAIASSVGFSTYARQDHHVWSEAVIDRAGETMHITYKHQDKSGGPVETGEASAAKLRMGP